MTNAYRKIGEGVTDSNGRITVSYTGKGAGKLQLIAKNGDLSSLPLEIYDCIWYDAGTSNDHNDEYGTQWSANLATLTRNTDYSSITGDDSSTKYWVWNFRSYDFRIIEFDLMKISGNLSDIILQLRNNSYSVLRQVALSTWSNTSLNTWYHFKFDFENKLIYLGGNSVSMNDINPSKLMFAVSSETTELRLRNLKVY